MTFFTNANEDGFSVTPDAAATGPLVGFLESWQVAVEAQMRTSSQFGIEYFMHDLDWKQTQAMMEAGVEDPPQLMLELEASDRGQGAQSVAQYLRKDSGYYEDFLPERSGEYLDVARKVAGETVSPEFEERMKAYDKRVRQIMEKKPDLKLQTASQMYDVVRKEAQAAEQREQTDRRTWGGAFGGFFGGALSSLHPGTDPLNFYTLGVGGAGRTAVQRIVAQAGTQGVVEAVNQATGVQEERRLLGLTHGFGDAAMRVGGTALGGAALQGLGEGLVAGARRWFRNTTTDPAPPPPETARDPLRLPHPDQFKEEAQVARLEQDGRSYLDVLADQAPLSGIRAGNQRTAMDVNDVTQQLESWDGAAPVNIVPRTQNVALPGVRTPARVEGLDRAVEQNQLHQVARQSDPLAFSKFDKLRERRNTYRRWLEELNEQRDADVQDLFDKMQERLRRLEAQRQSVQGKSAKAKIREQIREVKRDIDQLTEVSKTRESPDTAMVRRELLKVDERMRDVAPLIGRAYARARGDWGETQAQADAVWAAYRDGRNEPEFPDEAPTTFDDAMALPDRAPLLRTQPADGEAATSTLTARRVVAENAKVLDEAVERYRLEIGKLVATAEDGKIVLDGRTFDFDLDGDRMFVPGDDGVGREVTMRQFLDEVREASDELEAVSTCSIR